MTERYRQLILVLGAVLVVVGSIYGIIRGCGDRRQVIQVAAADALAVSLGQLVEIFESENPDTEVRLTVEGSVMLMRMHLLHPFDVVAVADHRLIEEAAALLIAAVATFRSASHAVENPHQPTRLSKIMFGVPFGTLIGFVSGVVGIGGGVFLGPLILFLRWSGSKEVAAMNSLLVLTLSAAGLVGHGLRGSISVSLVIPFAIAALLGGLLGAHIGERKLSPVTLQRILAVVVLAAGIRAAIDATGYVGN